MELADISIHRFIQKHEIKNEKGDPLDFRNHLFLFDIYRDSSQYICVMKAAQVGLSTLDVIKTIYDAKKNKMDIIYTLPTDKDVEVFVGGKVNRIISQNPILQSFTKDKDTIEQKSIGESMIYFRGTWTEKAAIMVTADRLVHDEKDSSKQDVVREYQARLQHSKFKQVHVFSHPSAEGTGVHTEWLQSDQKHWFIKCNHCQREQFLSWPASINMDTHQYVCKFCKKPLTDEARRVGRWVAKHKDRKYSGYWIPLLIAPWVSAAEIIEKFNDKDTTEEFFYNKVLGLPYTGSGNKLTKTYFKQNLTTDSLYPEEEERLVIGIDTGKNLHCVMGTARGLFYYGEKVPTEKNDHDPWIDIYGLMNRWPKMVAIVDQGGDLIGARKFQAKYKGRVFLCSYREDAKGMQLIRFGKKEEQGGVAADRNRMISLVVEEFTDRRIAVQGDFETGGTMDWYDYWLQWNNLTKVKELDPKTGQVKRRIWVRSGADHFAHATVYWRIGIKRFGGKGIVIHADSPHISAQPGVVLDAGMTTKAPNVNKINIATEQHDDWRTA
jgi:hypothetical protein